VIQWDWKQDVFPSLGQYNFIHEALVAKWKDLRPYLFGKNLHFAHVFDAAGEDTVTTAYLRDTAATAGLESKSVVIDDLGLDPDGNFIDLDDDQIEVLFKLYPWEMLANEDYGRRLVAKLGSVIVIEPVWKMMWSNKGILPLLKTLDPENPYLLDAALRRAGGGALREEAAARSRGREHQDHRRRHRLAQHWRPLRTRGLRLSGALSTPRDGTGSLPGPRRMDRRWRPLRHGHP
jgi:glutathionylspermidine synthase